MRSDCRGVARGTAPKRSRSARGPPVCIISIAQQARPNSMYKSDDLRVQLSIASTWVVTVNSGMVLMRLIALRGFPRLRCTVGHALHPLEVALHPHVREPDREHGDERADLDQR